MCDLGLQGSGGCGQDHGVLERFVGARQKLAAKRIVIDGEAFGTKEAEEAPQSPVVIPALAVVDRGRQRNTWITQWQGRVGSAGVPIRGAQEPPPELRTLDRWPPIDHGPLQVVHRDGQVRGTSTGRPGGHLLGGHHGRPVDHYNAESGPDRDGVLVDRHDVAQRISDAVLDAFADHRAHAGPESVDRI